MGVAEGERPRGVVGVARVSEGVPEGVDPREATSPGCTGGAAGDRPCSGSERKR